MTFDFIIIGSGPAGCSLAIRLARSKAAPKVLLLEAGTAVEDAEAGWMSNRYKACMQYPAINWNYSTTAQAHLDGRERPYPRGKCLGGSSAINFAGWTTGPSDDYDEWARLVGDQAFAWRNARRVFDRIEGYDFDVKDEYRKYASPDRKKHGGRGPVSVEFGETWERGLTDVLDAAEECGLGLNADVNSGCPLGMGLMPANSKKGYRVSAATAYLADVPPNLTVVSGVTVSKIVLEGKRAVGVVGDGKQYMASKEVICSAGALDSPKLLMLSGIGDSAELQKHGIQVSHDLPGVGRNLQDHVLVPLVYRQQDHTNDRVSFFGDPAAVTKAQAQFAANGSGPLSVFYQGIVMGWFKSDAVLASPEFAALPARLQQHIRKPTVPAIELATFVAPMMPDADPQHNYLTLVAFGMNPQSRGSVKLASADPAAPPVTDPQFVADAYDRRVIIEAVKRVMQWAETPALKKDMIGPVAVPKSTSDEDVFEYVKAMVGTSWHPSCTVKMGRGHGAASGLANGALNGASNGVHGDGEDEAMDCVDAEFKVMGVEGLRVVDLSVLPFLLNCHPVSIAYLLGDIAGDKMIKEYGLDQ